MTPLYRDPARISTKRINAPSFVTGRLRSRSSGDDPWGMLRGFEGSCPRHVSAGRSRYEESHVAHHPLSLTSAGLGKF
jgi:hypothetical protein